MLLSESFQIAELPLFCSPSPFPSVWTMVFSGCKSVSWPFAVFSAFSLGPLADLTYTISVKCGTRHALRLRVTVKFGKPLLFLDHCFPTWCGQGVWNETGRSWPHCIPTASIHTLKYNFRIFFLNYPRDLIGWKTHTHRHSDADTQSHICTQAFSAQQRSAELYSSSDSVYLSVYLGLWRGLHLLHYYLIL